MKAHALYSCVDATFKYIDFLLKTLWQKYAVMLSDISMIQYHYLSKQNEGCFNVV